MQHANARPVSAGHAFYVRSYTAALFGEIYREKDVLKARHLFTPMTISIAGRLPDKRLQL
jgi:hypothetical protein